MSNREYLSPRFPVGVRLGNVMFTLAAAYVHSLKTGVELRVPWDQNEAAQVLGEFLGYPFRATNNGRNERASYREPHFHHAPIPESVRSGGLHGYFQSWKYFEGYEDKVRELYSKFILPKDKETTGVHIRLGDYKALAFKHRIADNAFLARAFAKLKTHTKLKDVILFSDELPEAAARLFRVDGVDGRVRPSCHLSEDPCGDLMRMTSCENMVISASTYSWWGAWLGQAKRVIAPKEWFVSQIDDYEDVCPPTWIRL